MEPADQLPHWTLDLKRNRVDTPDGKPLFIKWSRVERVPDFKFLGVHVEEHLISGVHTTAVTNNIGLRLYFLRTMRNNHIDQKLLSTVVTERTS